MTEAAPRKKVTIPMLIEKKKKGEPIVQLAVYDYETAIIADRVGIDILCVSDTGGMVLFGHESTTSVSFEEVMFMAQAVKRGSQYGKSDDQGSSPVDSPVHPTDLVATIYYALGINPAMEILNDLKQPRELVKGEPLMKLFG